MSRALLAASIVLFVLASICAFGFHAHEPVAVVFGLDSAGFVCLAASRLV